MAKRGIRRDLSERLLSNEAEKRWLVADNASDARRLRAAVQRGDLLSPAKGVYALPPSWQAKKPTVRLLYTLRALQRAHPDWVFCGPSAALAYGLAVSYPLTAIAHVAVSRKSHVDPSGARGIMRHVVEGDEPVEVEGLRLTSAERTIFDCLRSQSFRDGIAIADSALFNGLASREQLAASFEDFSGRFAGRRRAIDTLKLADGRAESGGESVVRAVLMERGFRLPELQHEVKDIVNRDRSYRVDFYWDLGSQGEVYGELDGHEKYVNLDMTQGRSSLRVLLDERRRESRISGTKAKVMRFSYGEAVDRWTFTWLLCSYGIPRDAEIPWVAWRDDDPEANLLPAERLFLGRWLPFAAEHGLALPRVS